LVGELFEGKMCCGLTESIKEIMAGHGITEAKNGQSYNGFKLSKRWQRQMHRLRKT